jgi:hypothetical protein
MQKFMFAHCSIATFSKVMNQQALETNSWHWQQCLRWYNLFWSDIMNALLALICTMQYYSFNKKVIRFQELFEGLHHMDMIIIPWVLGFPYAKLKIFPIVISLHLSSENTTLSIGSMSKKIMLWLLIASYFLITSNQIVGIHLDNIFFVW